MPDFDTIITATTKQDRSNKISMRPADFDWRGNGGDSIQVQLTPDGVLSFELTEAGVEKLGSGTNVQYPLTFLDWGRLQYRWYFVGAEVAAERGAKIDFNCIQAEKYYGDKTGRTYQSGAVSDNRRVSGDAIRRASSGLGDLVWYLIGMGPIEINGTKDPDSTPDNPLSPPILQLNFYAARVGARAYVRRFWVRELIDATWQMRFMLEEPKATVVKVTFYSGSNPSSPPSQMQTMSDTTWTQWMPTGNLPSPDAIATGRIELTAQETGAPLFNETVFAQLAMRTATARPNDPPLLTLLHKSIALQRNILLMYLPPTRCPLLQLHRAGFARETMARDVEVGLRLPQLGTPRLFWTSVAYNNERDEYGNLRWFDTPGDYVQLYPLFRRMGTSALERGPTTQAESWDGMVGALFYFGPSDNCMGR